MIDKNQLMQVSNIVLSYVLDLNESDVEALIEGNKVIKLAQQSQKVKEEQLELELEVTKLKEPKKVTKKSNKKAALKKVEEEDIIKEIIIVEEHEEIKVVDNCDEVTEEDIINETINKINKLKTKKEAFSFLNEKRFTVKVLTTIAKKSNIYVKSRSKREVIIEKIIEGVFGE